MLIFSSTKDQFVFLDQRNLVPITFGDLGRLNEYIDGINKQLLRKLEEEVDNESIASKIDNIWRENKVYKDLYEKLLAIYKIETGNFEYEANLMLLKEKSEISSEKFQKVQSSEQVESLFEEYNKASNAHYSERIAPILSQFSNESLYKKVKDVLDKGKSTNMNEN